MDEDLPIGESMFEKRIRLEAVFVELLAPGVRYRMTNFEDNLQLAIDGLIGSALDRFERAGIEPAKIRAKLMERFA